MKARSLSGKSMLLMKKLSLSSITFQNSKTNVATLERRERRSFMENKTNSVDIKGEWILLRWRKSLWKDIWKELLLYTLVYMLISITYRSGILSSNIEKLFQRFVKYFRDVQDFLPTLTFILGLYVALVVKRWWDQYKTLPWPDKLALHLRACLIGVEDKEEKALLVRRSIMRYCLVSYILAIRTQSSILRERFPTINKIAKTGLLQEDEVKKIQDEENWRGELYTSRWWVPIQWCNELLLYAKHEGLVEHAPEYVSLVAQVAKFKHKLEMVKAYGSIQVPLVYTQAVHLAVYVYFVIALISEQYIAGDAETDLDEFIYLYFPFLLVFKFMFYYGLLGVAKSLYNPWGNDEEDFKLNQLLSRHLKVSMEIVDGTNKAPELRKDAFWGKPNPELMDKDLDGAVRSV